MTARPPGEFLKDELEARGLTAQQFAQMSGLSVEQLRRIFLAEHVLDADTAVKLGKALGTSDRLWINLQAQYGNSTPLEALRRFREAGTALHIQLQKEGLLEWELAEELEQARKDGKIK